MAPQKDVLHDVVVFSIAPETNIATVDAVSLLHAVRRALMALSRDNNRHVPQLFSGHEREGASTRSGGHDHIFLAADDADGDGRIDRLIVAAPWACDRTTKGSNKDRVCFDRVSRELTNVRAGRLGVLTFSAPRVPWRLAIRSLALLAYGKAAPLIARRATQDGVRTRTPLSCAM